MKACPRGSTYTNIFVQLNDIFDVKHGRKCWPVSSAVGFVRCCKVVAEAIEEEVDKVVILGQREHGHIEEANAMQVSIRDRNNLSYPRPRSIASSLESTATELVSLRLG